MKVFAVIGYTKTGKTTTIEEIIKELKRRNYSVGSVKDIHFEQFKIDKEGTNTHRHMMAGSELVTARGLFETDILYQKQLDIYQIASFYDHDFLVLEGYSEANVPKIVTGKNFQDLDEKIDQSTFAVSGRIAAEIAEYKGLKAINALENVAGLVDLIEEISFELLPDYDQLCCGACGYDCRTMCGLIVSGKKKRSDCIINQDDVSLKINDKAIPMVPFVARLVKNAALAVVSELDGYQENAHIKIEFGYNEKKYQEK